MPRPSGREYLQSILTSCSLLLELSDSELDTIVDGLKRVDDELDEALIYKGLREV